jgi:hypothetical protein
MRAKSSALSGAAAAVSVASLVTVSRIVLYWMLVRARLERFTGAG